MIGEMERALRTPLTHPPTPEKALPPKQRLSLYAARTRWVRLMGIPSGHRKYSSQKCGQKGDLHTDPKETKQGVGVRGESLLGYQDQSHRVLSSLHQVALGHLYRVLEVLGLDT